MYIIDIKYSVMFCKYSVLFYFVPQPPMFLLHHVEVPPPFRFPSFPHPLHSLLLSYSQTPPQPLHLRRCRFLLPPHAPPPSHTQNRFFQQDSLINHEDQTLLRRRFPLFPVRLKGHPQTLPRHSQHFHQLPFPLGPNGPRFLCHGENHQKGV